MRIWQARDKVAAATGDDRHTARMVLVNGANRFSIHALVYKDAATAASIRGIIEERKSNRLTIEALTYYGFLAADATILFFVADRQSYAENKAIFEAIKQRYETK